MPHASWQTRRCLCLPRVSPCCPACPQISELVVAGKVKPIIDRVLPLEQIAEAHEFMETERARGKVVIKVAQ